MAEMLVRVHTHTHTHTHTQGNLINKKEISINERYALFEIYKTDQLI